MLGKTKVSAHEAQWYVIWRLAQDLSRSDMVPGGIIENIDVLSFGSLSADRVPKTQGLLLAIFHQSMEGV